MLEKRSFELLFITTCNTLSYIFKLLTSIKKNNDKSSILIIIVCQDNIIINVNEYQTKYIQIQTLNYSKKLSLSFARNCALRYIIKHHISYDYIMFPDDDSVYDEFFFKLWSKTALGNKLISIKYSDKEGYFNLLRLPSGTLLSPSHYKMASSVNMIIDRKTVEAIGLFDERLGVGALYGSGEDSDYFIRATKISPFRAYPWLYNMHPSAYYKYRKMDLKDIIRRFNNYGKGMVFALCKNHLEGDAFKLCYRALGGCIINILRLRFYLAIAYGLSFFSRTFLLVKLLIVSGQKRA